MKKFIIVIIAIIIVVLIAYSSTNYIYNSKINNVFETVISNKTINRKGLYKKLKKQISKDAFESLDYSEYSYAKAENFFGLFLPYPLCCATTAEEYYVTVNTVEENGKKSYEDVVFSVELKPNFDIYIKDVLYYEQPEINQ